MHCCSRLHYFLSVGIFICLMICTSRNFFLFHRKKRKWSVLIWYSLQFNILYHLVANFTQDTFSFTWFEYVQDGWLFYQKTWSWTFPLVVVCDLSQCLGEDLHVTSSLVSQTETASKQSQKEVLMKGSRNKIRIVKTLFHVYISRWMHVCVLKYLCHSGAFVISQIMCEYMAK